MQDIGNTFRQLPNGKYLIHSSHTIVTYAGFLSQPKTRPPKAGNRRSDFLLGFTSMASENPMAFPLGFLIKKYEERKSYWSKTHEENWKLSISSLISLEFRIFLK